MKTLFLILHVWTAVSIRHDIAVAIFKLSDSNGTLQLDITMDSEDLYKALPADKADTTDKLQELLPAYLQKHLDISIDDQVFSCKSVSVTARGDHLQIHVHTALKVGKIKKITIRNTCLLSVANHSNIIQLDLNERSRDYRMHKHRQEIIVEY